MPSAAQIASAAESFLDYAKLITGLSRYAPALAYPGYHQVREYLQMIAVGGYATSPTYAESTNNVANTIKKHVSEEMLNEALKKKTVGGAWGVALMGVAVGLAITILTQNKSSQ